MKSEKKLKLILASQSPRRAELLKKSGYFFIQFPVYVSEIPGQNLSLDQQILDIANQKLEAAIALWKQKPSDEGRDFIFLASDTMVCMENIAYGKPENEQIAFEYLTRFSGKSHQVKTAVHLFNFSTNEKVSHIETSTVTFKKNSPEIIKEYIATGEPMDKAGAYGIQGFGQKLIESFDGDYNNVVGLPLHAVEKILMIQSWQLQKI